MLVKNNFGLTARPVLPKPTRGKSLIEIKGRRGG
jgi:hypothetical protein